MLFVCDSFFIDFVENLQYNILWKTSLYKIFRRYYFKYSCGCGFGYQALTGNYTVGLDVFTEQACSAVKPTSERQEKVAPVCMNKEDNITQGQDQLTNLD